SRTRIEELKPIAVHRKSDRLTSIRGEAGIEAGHDRVTQLAGLLVLALRGPLTDVGDADSGRAKVDQHLRAEALADLHLGRNRPIAAAVEDEVLGTQADDHIAICPSKTSSQAVRK